MTRIEQIVQDLYHSGKVSFAESVAILATIQEGGDTWSSAKIVEQYGTLAAEAYDELNKEV